MYFDTTAPALWSLLDVSLVTFALEPQEVCYYTGICVQILEVGVPQVLLYNREIWPYEPNCDHSCDRRRY